MSNLRNISRMSQNRGSNRRNARMNSLVLLIIVAAIVLFALLHIEVIASIVLFILSSLGMVIFMVIGKPGLTPEDKLRESTIKQYQVPNTKEALMEFTILALEKISPVKPIAALFSVEAKRQAWLNKVWRDKLDTVYTRARLAMKDDPTSLGEITRLCIKAGVKV